LPGIRDDFLDPIPLSFCTFLWKIYLVLTFPLVALRARAIWPFAGGWALQYGQRRAIGINRPINPNRKPESRGNSSLNKTAELNETVQTVTCHGTCARFYIFIFKLPTLAA